MGEGALFFLLSFSCLLCSFSMHILEFPISNMYTSAYALTSSVTVSY